MKSYLLHRIGLGDTSCPRMAESSRTEIGVFTTAQTLPSAENFVIRWGTPGGQLADGQKVLNKSSAMNETSNKREFRIKMAREGIAPRTWSTRAGCLSDWNPSEGKVMVRPSFHERSSGIYVCSTPVELDAALSHLGGFYISDFIEKDQEFRVFVIQGRVAWVIEKNPIDRSDPTWGCVTEGNFSYVEWTEWPEHVVRNALAAMDLSSLDFGAVDVISLNGRAYSLEINTAPYLTPYYGKAIMRCLDWMNERAFREKLPHDGPWGWRNFIHPGMHDEAVYE